MSLSVSDARNLINPCLPNESGVFCSVRYQNLVTERVQVERGVVAPTEHERSHGIMVTVHAGGGNGYAATADLSPKAIRSCVATATKWAKMSGARWVTDFSRIAMPSAKGVYQTKVEVPWRSVSLADKIERMKQVASQVSGPSAITDWSVDLRWTRDQRLYLTNQGGDVEQTTEFVVPEIWCVASDESDSVMRSLGGYGSGQGGGLEVLDHVEFWTAGPRVMEEALELLKAPNCPQGEKQVVLSPDQMILQIHESIGHPIELDRILGDERNYAGWSFVKPEMFGTFRYGSDLLNIVFDPGYPGEIANYQFDDEGLPAEKVHMIKDGILQRPLGGVVSQARAGLPGVANGRVTHWSRPAIDRMANLNLVPGQSSFDDMIAAVDDGVYMETNCSWSIDDCRNKFQFGCERGRLIKNGRLQHVVKKPCYRGFSRDFWLNLSMVGDQSTVGVMGSPFCGKGEPNQAIHVGHVSPTCVFDKIDVFGGEA